MEKDRPGKSSHTVTACCQDSIERRSSGFAEKSRDGWFKGREGGATWSSVGHSQDPRVKPRCYAKGAVRSAECDRVIGESSHLIPDTIWVLTQTR